MQFEFCHTGRIFFGNGLLYHSGVHAHRLGKKALLLSGKNIARIQQLCHDLEKHKVEYLLFPVAHEPTIPLVVEAVELARKNQCDLVIGMGGGSVIDTAKAVSVLLTNPGDILDYVEIIGKGKLLSNPSAPCIAIPTTAGTGTEVTKNATLISPVHKIKVSLRSPSMIPTIAIVDPELTISMPPELTASSGLDAITQLIESFVSNHANPLTDAFCRDALKRASHSIVRAYENGQDTIARQDMALASLCGGLALANAKLGAVHGFAAALGGMFTIAHGVVCACLLPYVLDVNIAAVRSRGSKESLQRFGEVAQIVCADNQAKPEDGVWWCKRLIVKMNIPRLSKFGVRQEHVSILVEKARNASSMKGNPVVLLEQELTRIVELAL